ncbi:hypothetical protein EYY83_12235 [Hafnia alvei]|uniref:DUF6575 domain-containing protein n=1 Tax=Hafnia alvei TaxID=569 RepID=UPI001034F520|nr:DUF6575 domain-containing protein [Hafnia alvei]TBM14375.1 hypothetical protein EYY83_12235 [Hafnia alvei]
MKNTFLEDSCYGPLYLKNIYEFFEEPRFFSVTNEVDCLFIVYWIGDEDDFDKWLIIPISKERLEHLERKRIDINSALTYQESKHYYQVNIPYDDSEKPAFIKFESADIRSSIKLPKTNLYISGVTPVLDTGKLGQQLQFSTHEIHVEKSSKSTLPLELSGVSKVFDFFNGFYNSVLDAFDQKDSMKPVSARPGSFVLAFQADKMESIEPLLKGLHSTLINRADIENFIIKNKIDAQCLNTLFQSVIDTSSDFELKNNNTEEIILNVRKVDAEFYIKKLARLSSVSVSGIQVPQANIITKVFEIVVLKWQGKLLNLESTGLDARHVLYYIHAARLLGFISDNGSVTALGQQLAEAKDDEERCLRIAAKSFESSHCGWAWITWCEVANLRELDPKTAEPFLLANCTSLSKATIRRRASTLRQWCEELKPFYRDF